MPAAAPALPWVTRSFQVAGADAVVNVGYRPTFGENQYGKAEVRLVHITRDELRQRLWPADTYVDFERGRRPGARRDQHAGTGRIGRRQLRGRSRRARRASA